MVAEFSRLRDAGSIDDAMSSRLRIFFGFNIHSCSGLEWRKKNRQKCARRNSLTSVELENQSAHLMQFHRTQGNHRATPSSTTRKTTSKRLRLSSGTFFFQNSPSISDNIKQTVMISMTACETRPRRDWCS